MSLSATQAELTNDERALIDKAKSITGVNPSGNVSLGMRDSNYEDQHLKPLRCFLPDSAPLLAVLESGPVQDAGRHYHRHDDLAMKQQILFKKQKLRIIVPLVIALAVSVFALFGGPSNVASWLSSGSGDEAEKLKVAYEACFKQAVLYLVFLGLVGTPLLALWMKPDDSYKTWTTSRGLAEAMRTEFFKRVFDAPASAPPGNPNWPLLLKFEYFRRWQLEVQAEYFKKRQKAHAKTVGWARRGMLCYYSLFGLWFAIMALAMVGSQDEHGPPVLRPSASSLYSGTMSLFQSGEQLRLDQYTLYVAIVFAIAAIFITYWTLISAARRNSARFEVMKDNFAEIRSKIEAVRAAAASGREAEVRQFVDRVHSTMAVEYADWVRLAELDLGKDPNQAWFGDGAPPQPAP